MMHIFTPPRTSATGVRVKPDRASLAIRRWWMATVR